MQWRTWKRRDTHQVADADATLGPGHRVIEGAGELAALRRDEPKPLLDRGLGPFGDHGVRREDGPFMEVLVHPPPVRVALHLGPDDGVLPHLHPCVAEALVLLLGETGAPLDVPPRRLRLLGELVHEQWHVGDVRFVRAVDLVVLLVAPVVPSVDVARTAILVDVGLHEHIALLPRQVGRLLRARRFVEQVAGHGKDSRRGTVASFAGRRS